MDESLDEHEIQDHIDYAKLGHAFLVHEGAPDVASHGVNFCIALASGYVHLATERDTLAKALEVAEAKLCTAMGVIDVITRRFILLEKKHGIAMNALDNIKHWKTFGAMNNGREMCSHAFTAMNEIKAIEETTVCELPKGE
jgi:LDH2 family malate/lactate/ureidoglycolate dehydrogenase